MFNNKEIISLFDLESLQGFGEYYTNYVYPFQYVYQSKPKWSTVQYTTINGVKSRSLSLLNTLPFVSRNITKLILSEDIYSDNEILNNLIFTNNFNVNLRKLIEQSIAMGYGVIKTYIDGTKDENGNVVSDFQIKFSYYPADRFIPISWNSEYITEAVFIDKFTHKGKFYTKLEYHSIIDKDYQIRQELYRSDSPNILGYLTPIEEVFGSTLSPVLFIRNYNSTTPLYSLINNPISNNVNSNLPISPSMFIDSLDTLKNLDIIYDSFAREFILGKRRMIVPAQLIKKVVDPNTGNLIRYFDANDEIYQAMNFDNTDNLKITDNTLPLRVEDHVKALNFFLHTLAIQLGISPGSLSFDQASGIRTASEVVFNQHSTAQFVASYQSSIKSSLDNLIQSILNICYAYNIISTPKLNYQIIIPDSIIEPQSITSEVI